MFLSVLKIAPVNPVLDLAEIKNYLRIDDTADDVLITALIASATRKVEYWLDKKLITQTWELYADRIPMAHKREWWDGSKEMAISELMSGKRDLVFPFGPLQSVTSFETFDNDNQAYTFDSSNYVIDAAGPMGRLALKLGASWPTTVLRPINGIKITGVFGYGDSATAIPHDIVLATKILVAHLYEHRGDEVSTFPITCITLLESHRLIKAANR